jgi:hypothetical protein
MYYRKSIQILIICLITGILLGCGLKEGVIEKDSKSLLWFTGDTNGAIVLIDDQMQIDLSRKGSNVIGEEGSVHRSNSEKYYRITPGKHNIVIKKSGKVVLERNLLLEAGVVKEISVP